MSSAVRSVTIALVAVLTFHLLRTQVCERYRVGSVSMEPTIHGDRSAGDLVLVDKLAYRFRDPRPFDLVVVRGGTEGQIVKRLICLAGEHGAWVAIRGGDLWSGADEHCLARLVKDPVASKDLRITHWELAGNSGEAVDEQLRGARWTPPVLELEPAASDAEGLHALLREPAHGARRTAEPADLYVPGHLSTRHPVDLSFVDLAGRRHAVGAGFDRDIGLELDLEPGPGVAAVQIVVEHHDTYWSVLWSGGSVVLEKNGTPLGTAAALAGPEPGRRVALSFGHLDGRFFLEVEGRLVLLREQELADVDLEPRFRGPRLENLLHVGSAGGPLRIRALRVFRDLWYRAPQNPGERIGAPARVEAGQMYLLGDNTFDSLDSRMRTPKEGQFARDDLIGRPLAVIAPRARARWFTR